MDYLGLDIAKARFDAHLITATGKHHASFSNTQAGFEQLATWLARHQSPPPNHAMPAWRQPETGALISPPSSMRPALKSAS